MTCLGFQFTRRLEEELGIKLQWFDNKPPEYQVTVSSLLCNQEE